MDDNLPPSAGPHAVPVQDPFWSPSNQAHGASDPALTRLLTIEADLAAMRAALEETHAHLTRTIVALSAAEDRIAALKAALARAEHELAHARGTIQNMERSVFWRARRVWAAVSRALGRPA